MASYYNKTKGPVAVSLRRGNSVVVGPKRWAVISPEDEGHESLQRAVIKGFLVRSAAEAVAPVVEASVPAPTIPEAAPVDVKPAPDSQEPISSEPKPGVSEVSEVSGARSGKKKWR